MHEPATVDQIERRSEIQLRIRQVRTNNSEAPNVMHLSIFFKRTLAVAGLALFTASSASALQIEMKTWQSGSVGYYRANPVGDFEDILDNYTPGKSTDGTWFGTFCIEKNESFRSGHTYDVEINDGAISGGRSGASNGKDVISKGTAWLYEQYATGMLSGLNYNSKNSLKILQYAIWYLEGEIGYKSSIAGFLSSAQAALNLNLTGIKGDYEGASVKVMNLTQKGRNGETNQHQDQLVYLKVPDTGSTLALLSLALVSIIAISRRLA